jgi:hypothetical protein
MNLKIFLITIMCLITFQSNSQELLKEISKAFDNGQPMFIDYLETENLKKVKRELYNEKGTLVFSIKFNKESGLPNGEFYDLINKGYFDNGELNCKNCMLVEANSPSVYTYNNERMNTEIIIGDVVKGRLVGEVKKYEQYEETYNKVDWNSTRRYVAAGAGIGFRDVKTYTTGKFTKTLVDTKVYNINGVLDGTVNVSYITGRYPDEVRLNARLSVKNGIIKSLVSYDEKGVQRDSVSNEQKIWKIDYKYIKNEGFLMFEMPKNIMTESFSNIENFITYYGLKNENEGNGIIVLGGVQNFYRTKVNTGGQKLGLDSDGLFTINLEGMFDYIISYDLGENNRNSTNSNSNNGFYDYNTRDNFLGLIYNYVHNGAKSLFEKRFKANDYRENSASLEDFLNILKSSHYSKDSYGNALRKNAFTKFLKTNTIPWKRDDSERCFYITVEDFFNNIIVLSDYLKACQESMEKDYTEIQEIWVWNLVTNNYDKIDFIELIKLAEQKEEELKVRSENTKNIDSSLIKPLEDQTDSNKLIKIKNREANLEIQKNPNNEIKSVIEKLKIVASSEDRSLVNIPKMQKRQLEKKYNVKIKELITYKLPSNSKTIVGRYVFDNIKDLELLKKEFKSLQYEPYYEDLDSKTPSLYYKN